MPCGYAPLVSSLSIIRRGFSLMGPGPARRWATASLLLSAVAAGCDGCGEEADGGTGGGGSPSILPLPALVASSPERGALVARTAWVVLTFDAPVPVDRLAGLGLACEGAEVPEIDTDIFDSTRVVVNPRAELPAGAGCSVTWPGPAGEESLEFSVAAAGEPVPVHYDRSDPAAFGPVPDDFFLQPDAGTATGERLVVPVPAGRSGGVTNLLTSVLSPSESLDGQSPLAPFVIDLPAELDPSSLPLTQAASMDPLATIGLFDIDESSPTFAQRVPFHLVPKTAENDLGETEHQLLVFGGYPLEPRGQYALVVSRRALVDPTRPLEASAFFAKALGPAADRGTPEEQKSGGITDAVMAALLRTSPPVRTDDVALVLRASIRSMDHVADDRLEIRRQLQELPAPTFSIDEVYPDEVEGSPVAAIVRGTWQAPQWREGNFLARDDEGRPRRTADVDIPFVMTLPKEPLPGGAPVVMFQHAQPATSESVGYAARIHLPGYVVIGFTDPLNRASSSLGGINQLIFLDLFTQKRMPEVIALLANAEQMAFLKLIDELGGNLDVLPIGAPDGEAEIAADAPILYFGYSQGAHHGTGFLPFAPEITAACLSVAGGRWTAGLLHQDQPDNPDGTYAFVASFFAGITRSDFLNGISMVQAAVDDQDWLNVARLMYRQPLDLGSDGRASLLLQEGLSDTRVPAYSTSAAANAFGIPHLLPIARETPGLVPIEAPVRGNIDDATSAAFIQFVPSVDPTAAPSAGCEDIEEGHFCAVDAAPSIQQRLRFFSTAVEGVPEIVNPFAP